MFLQRSLVLISLTLVTSTLCSEDLNPKYFTINTEDGEIRGKSELSLFKKRIFYAFKGIPYAKPPLGGLRFKAPQKVDPWSGVLNTTEYGSLCLQPTMDDTNDFHGDEDCLTLNVFIPDITFTIQKPVIFYIHSGAYMYGGASVQGPDILLDEDVILVTINYRLGPFGFLCFNTPEYSGNMGLKDQLIALKWTNDNIHHFGGDKNQITIYGHSAGSISVNFHLISPASRNLFRRAIASSGSVLNPFSYNSRNHTDILLNLMSEESEVQSENASFNDVISWVQSVDGKFIGKSTFVPAFVGGKRYKSVNLNWAPVIEATNSDEPFFTKTPIEYLNEPSNIDALFGYTSAESIFLAPSDVSNADELKPFDQHFEIDLPLVGLNYTFDSDAYESYKNEIRNFYFGNKTVGADTLPEFVKLMGDAFFVYGIDKAVKSQAKRSSGKTYYYQFSAELGLNLYRLEINASALGLKGATHIEDMFYLFSSPSSIHEGLKSDSDESHMIQTLRNFVVNFVKFGNPTPNNEPVNVKPIENSTINFVDIRNEGLFPDVNPHAETISFWDEFFVKHPEVFPTTQ